MCWGGKDDSTCDEYLQVVINSQQEKMDVAIRTSFDDTRDLVQYMQVNVLDGRNNVVNPAVAILIDKIEDAPYTGAVTVQVFQDKSGNNCIGFAMGYLPIDSEDGYTMRTVNDAWSISTSKKSYPHFVDDGYGEILEENTTISGVAYRKFFPIEKENNINQNVQYIIPFGNEVYLYRDYYKDGIERIVLPEPYRDKTAILIQKSNGVETYTLGNTMWVRHETEEKAYEHVVLKLK